jgi:hypothetical protein
MRGQPAGQIEELRGEFGSHGLARAVERLLRGYGREC